MVADRLDAAARAGSTLCLPTGATPRTAYAQLGLQGDLSRASVFLLDEFVLPNGAAARCDTMLRRDLLDRLKHQPDRLETWDTMAPDLEAECEKLKRLLDPTLQRSNSGSIGLGSALCLFLASQKRAPKLIAEVGTYIGNSAAAMGCGAGLNGQAVQLITCDMHPCTQQAFAGLQLHGWPTVSRPMQAASPAGCPSTRQALAAVARLSHTNVARLSHTNVARFGNILVSHSSPHVAHSSPHAAHPHSYTQ